MSEFSTLYINNYEVDSWQNSIGWARELFTENDFVETIHDYEEDTEPTPAYQYVTTAANLIDRLEVLGFTIEMAKRRFEEGKSYLLEESEERNFIESYDDTENISLTPPYAPFNVLTQFYSNYTFEYWLRLINKVLTRRIRRIWLHSDSDKRRQARIAKENIHLYHILEHRSNFEFGFPIFDPFCLYRSLLEAVKPNTSIVLDFTYLVNFVASENYFCEPPKTIILTEGSSDKRILEASLTILYPHLYDYYSFIDFDLASMPGSAGHLLNIIKAFIATGVERRTIALFDNDTAGLDAMRQLANIPLSENMKVMSLPNLEFAKNYPTIGPQGEVEIDINKLACSIELYLGQDILLDENNNYFPIQWGGYMQGAKKYQGEIINKGKLQEKYLALLSKVKTNPSLRKNHDWIGIQSILNSIFTAFQN